MTISALAPPLLLLGAAIQPTAGSPAQLVMSEMVAPVPASGRTSSEAPVPAAVPAALPDRPASETPAAAAVPAATARPPDEPTSDNTVDPWAAEPVPPSGAAPEQRVAGRQRHAPGDPLEGFNRRMFAVQQGLDRAVFRRAGVGYRQVVPSPLRGGLRNAFRNIGEPIVFVNYLLQLKPGKAAETLGRFLVNSTIGMGGLIDVARRPPFRLPHRPNGFGNTLALHGIGPGPYLFLPLLGPSTLRDFVGAQSDALVLPRAVGKPFDQAEYQVPRAVITGLDQRAEADDELSTLFAGAIDPYATLRSVYLQNRASEIAELRGGHVQSEQPPTELDDPLTDPDTEPGTVLE